MRIIKIKNNTVSTRTYSGQDILAGEYHQIQDEAELVSFLTTTLLSDINTDINDPALIIVNDGVADLNYTQGQNWLLDLQEKSVVSKPSNEFSMQMNAVSTTCTKDSTTSMDLKIENYGSETYTYKYIWGGMIFGKDMQYGDYAVFQIVDKDGFGVYAGWYDQATFDAMGNEYVVKEYVKKSYVDPNKRMEFESEAPGAVPIGLYLRCKYTATDAGVDRTIFVNYDLHIKDNE